MVARLRQVSWLLCVTWLLITGHITGTRCSVQHNRRDKEPAWKFFHFVTRPDIGAPKWSIEVEDQDALAPGYWFVAPYAHLDQINFPLWNGPHIYRGDGELVWSGAPLFEHYNTFDFRIVTVDGQEKLSLICPEMEHHAGVILDNDYNISHAVNLRGELDHTNMHDFTVVDDGERALTLSIVKGNASPEESRVIGVEGGCRVGWEGFRELDVATSEILFDWSAQGHIGLDEVTKTPVPYEELCSNGWDILHLNAIDKFPDGDYLISSRHTDTIYKISHTDGSIVWRLGGVKSDFKLKDDAKFSRQHDARVYAQNETHTLISLFDNAKGDGKGEKASNDFSRGLLLQLKDDSPRTAELIKHYDHPNHAITNSRGSLQFLPNGNAFMGWTYGSQLSEHNANGKVLMKAHFKHGLAHTYRAYKYPWIGHPSQPPDIVAAAKATASGVQTTIHVSWNGATEVKTWKIFSADVHGSKQQALATVANQGFETKILHDGYISHVILEANDANGVLLGSSDATATITEEGMVLPAVKQGISRSIFGHHLVIFLLGVAATLISLCGYRIIRTLDCSKGIRLWQERTEYGPLATADEVEAWMDDTLTEGDEDERKSEGEGRRSGG